MKSGWLAVLATSLLLFEGRAVVAQVITVTAVPPVSMTVTTAVAGSNPTNATDGTSTYALDTKSGTGFTRITARVTPALPAGTTLFVNLPSPGGIVLSAGTVALTTAAQPVLTNLPNSNTRHRSTPINYTLSATPSAGVILLQAVVVTFEFAP